MFATDPEHALVPIFFQLKSAGVSDQIGTAVFVEFSGMPFLFTSAHVTDRERLGALVIPTPLGMLEVDGYLSYIDLLPDGSREDDSVDVAYWRLASEFARLLCTYFRPLPQARCRLIETALELGVCTVYGYPLSRAQRLGAKHSSETASYRGVAAAVEIYEQLGLSPETHIVVHFHRSRAVSTDGQRINPIHPRGLSGGGIFAWPEGHELSDDWSLPHLVGIFHTYKQSEGLMIGSHLINVMGSIQLGQMKNFGGVS